MNPDALIKVWNMTQQHPGTSGARVCAGILASLYNGQRFRVDLTDLRLLDASLLEAALTILADDARYPTREVHDHLNHLTGRFDFGPRIERLAYEWRLRGRCKKTSLEAVSPERLIIED